MSQPYIGRHRFEDELDQGPTEQQILDWQIHNDHTDNEVPDAQ